MANDWSPKGNKKAEAEKGLKLPDPSPHKDVFLKGRLADRIDDGTGQRDALKKLLNNPCENAFELSNWNTRYSLNRNNYSMDQLFDLVATGFTSGCSQNADVISAGLVQGLNYDYTAIDNGGSNISLTASGANVAIPGASCTLDCDGTYPVLAIWGCVAAAGSSDIVEFNIGLNGDVGDNTDDTYRWRIGYLSTGAGVVGTSYACMIDASEIPSGSNTFQVGYATAAVNPGTLYFSGVNTAFFMVIELKTVEGQITQAKVDNRTAQTIARISDWDNRPNNPTDEEVLVYNPTGDTSWTMQYDEANDYWLCIGGDDWSQYVYGTISTTATTPTTLTGETITFPSLPAGTWRVGLGYLGTTNVAYVWQVGMINGNQPEAAQQTQAANTYGMCEVFGEYTIASTTTLGPTFHVASNTGWFGRRHMSVKPVHLDN